MNIKFEGNLDELQEGIDRLSKALEFKQADNGLSIKVEKASGDLEVSLSGGRGHIKYEQKSHFFRALGLFIEAYQDKEQFKIVENPQFTMIGTMIDCSRNAVMTMPSMETFIEKIAIMGFNMIMLYTEDTYTIEDEPYFGHLRGRFTHSELKQIDDYAFQFGIEVIPCMQTLGHMKMVLKWPAYNEVSEDADVLLAGNENTYQLIDKMIHAVSSPFRSNRIHIGMDEAWGMGLGRNMRENGYRDRFDIFVEHINKVIEITNKYKLRPMIWSDMFFRMGSKTNKYTDLEAVIPEHVYRSVPNEVKLVYWDYYSRSEEIFRTFIKRHKKFGQTPIFAGGILTWGTFGTNYARTFEDANAALESCKKEGVQEVLTTIWQDDGAENTHFAALLGLQLYAEHAFAKQLSEEKLRKRVEFCTGIAYDAFMDLSLLDEIEGTNRENRWPPNVSKYALWQDPLLGLYDNDIKGMNLSKHYQELESTFANYVSQYGDKVYNFKVVHKLARVLSLKSDLGNRLRDAYLKKNLDELKYIAEENISDLSGRLELLRKEHRAHWFLTYKPFGWEVLDLRYGGLTNRLETTRQRVLDYVNGTIQSIDELEAASLPLDFTSKGLGNGFWKRYENIASPSFKV
ncbi:beta-N-acetylhexosaminidase [Radiobacillus sp. PE A8.2]|uniref:beta-N-acetylhexosaminidase n=1 Tax=Radiobacillus sp. PE A8.2 TaxID=3380349 RepID=UPI00388ED50A